MVLDEEAVGIGTCPATHPMAAMAGEQTLAAMELARSIVLEHALDTLAARLAPVSVHTQPAAACGADQA